MAFTPPKIEVNRDTAMAPYNPAMKPNPDIAP